ncbi:hypothetical protein GCM10011487_64130 [Steroidobacter agaridevorans]|uniref:DUF4238 domain-containing protein n=1 Tax=Steroidobacter agaridevorans TaxID=2695856 RepID=A0A829YNM1_9GAMM|nr:DUF4238 domain-containing protein [Steroidobacter agaridevorans]GFE84413.1 hypothetical protein GCM10011487_64130 [Steroidobacter agaridevorans]
MQKSKRNHWVSQAYLRAFASDPERREKIWRFGKDTGAPELKPIEKVAVRFYLYAPKGKDGKRDYAFEAKLSELEQWFGDPLWQRLCTEMVDLSWEPVRKMVSLLVAVMYLRTPAQFEASKAMHRQIVDVYGQFPELPSSFDHKGKMYRLDNSKWAEYRDASEDDMKRFWLSQVGSAVWLAEILMKMRWAVVFSDVPVFITTDNPVTIIHPSLRFRGLKNPETTLIFPLSPTRVLMMDNRQSEPNGHYYPLKERPGCFNSTLWRNAIEHMFSHRDPDIVCAEMLAEAERMGFA